MPSKDPDKAISRFITMVKRFHDGARIQRSRILDSSAAAPRLMPGTPYEVKNLTDVPPNDLDYYVYELVRLQDAARAMIKVFDKPPELIAALEAFDQVIPELRKIRNPLTHASDDARLERVGSFTALVRFREDGGIDYLVDPRYQHHDAAEALAEALLKFLRARLRASL